MKTIKPWFAVMSAALIITSSVYASSGHDRYRGYAPPKHMKMSNTSYHGNRHNGASWVVPLVIGGVLGYALSEPRRESVTYVSASRAPVVYVPQLTYQEQWVYFSDCDCQRKVLVPLR